MAVTFLTDIVMAPVPVLPALPVEAGAFWSAKVAEATAVTGRLMDSLQSVTNFYWAIVLISLWGFFSRADPIELLSFKIDRKSVHVVVPVACTFAALLVTIALARIFEYGVDSDAELRPAIVAAIHDHSWVLNPFRFNTGGPLMAMLNSFSWTTFLFMMLIPEIMMDMIARRGPSGGHGEAGAGSGSAEDALGFLPKRERFLYFSFMFLSFGPFIIAFYYVTLFVFGGLLIFGGLWFLFTACAWLLFWVGVTWLFSPLPMDAQER